MIRRFALTVRPALRLWLAGLLVLALASTAMAHRLAPERPDPALSAFLATGGTLNDLCRDHDTPGHATQPPCEACRLFSGILPTPSLPGTPVMLTARPTEVNWLAGMPVLVWPPLARHSPRAPPVMLTRTLQDQSGQNGPSQKDIP